MICARCGRENRPDNAFCGGCGAKLESVSSGERRQITVVFCDLVGSTRLSGQLDPEDFQELMDEYHKTCERVVRRFQGHTAQFLGDGVLIYFGFPTAHEDDPARAIRAGLQIIASLRAERTRMERRWGHAVSARIGINTGPVVVGEVGAGGARQLLALGETTNIAAHLQRAAEPDGVVASDATVVLTRGAFDTVVLRGLSLKGLPDLFVAHRVRGLRPDADATEPGGASPLVGRSAERAALLAALAAARDGSGRTVLITGEPGIGKSRLLEELRRAGRAVGEIGWTELRCHARDAARAYGPAVEALRARFFAEGDSVTLDGLRRDLEPLGEEAAVALELLAPHLAIETAGTLTSSWLPELRARRTVEALSELLMTSLGSGVGVLAVENLQWADTSTLELIQHLTERVRETRRLLVLTARPEFATAYDGPPGIEHIHLHGLSEREMGELIRLIAPGREISKELVRMVAERSDGNPLFTEEVANDLLERGEDLTRAASAEAVPATLRDLLNARLDRLGPVREVAQRLSVLGRRFPASWAPLVGSDIQGFDEKLADLIKADVLRRSDDSLQFKHALIQEAAYGMLLRRHRRRLHAQCAEAFESGFAEVAREQPALIAYHWTEADEPEKAIDAWLATAEHELTTNAIRSSGAAIDRGLALLSEVEDEAFRAARELALRFNRNFVLNAREGPASEAFRDNNARGLELITSPRDPRNVFLRLALATAHRARGELAEAESWYGEALRAADHVDAPGVEAMAHVSMARMALQQGRIDAVLDHTRMADEVWPKVGLRIGRPGIAIAPVDAASFRALALWHAGWPEKALQESRRAFALARAVEEPSGSESWARIYGSWLRILRGEAREALESAEEGRTVALETGDAACASCFAQVIAWAMCELDRGEEAATALERRARQALGAGHPFMVPYDLVLAGLAFGRAGQPGRGGKLVAEAIEMVDDNGERYAYPELLRAHAALRLADGGTEADAYDGFATAMAIADELGMRSWKLRAATDLAKLHLGDPSTGLQVLEPVYASFEEGQGTRDLREAAEVLERLRS